MEPVKLGCIDNAVVSFDISQHPKAEIDCLDIIISSRIDTDFVCKTTINGITPKDIDALCYELQSLKYRLHPVGGEKDD